MFGMDLGTTLSLVVAFCAILSPILTAIINNHYQLKLKRLELEQKERENVILHRRGIFENYLTYAGRCICHSGNDALADYGKHYYVVLMQAPPDLRGDMMAVNAKVGDDDWQAATSLLESLTPRIHAILQAK